MRTTYVLDTDTLVDLLRGKEDVIARLVRLSPDDVHVSAMSVAELHVGALGSRAPERDRAEVDRVLAPFPVLRFGRDAALEHARIRRALRHQPIGPADTVIAATAITAGAVLVTSNVREFRRVPGLVCESWREMAAR
jgi:tRNA(fMet)-specific endonuclease VapC